MAAVLLKAGVPMFAAWAAALQGVPVADVCPIYGVAWPAPRPHADHQAHAHHADQQAHAGHAGMAAAQESPGEDATHHRAHTGDHCALVALAALATFAGGHSAWPAAVQATTLSALLSPAHVRDEVATWAARLKHGPPVAA